MSNKYESKIKKTIDAIDNFGRIFLKGKVSFVLAIIVLPIISISIFAYLGFFTSNKDIDILNEKAGTYILNKGTVGINDKYTKVEEGKVDNKYPGRYITIWYKQNSISYRVDKDYNVLYSPQLNINKGFDLIAYNIGRFIGAWFIGVIGYAVVILFILLLFTVLIGISSIPVLTRKIISNIKNRKKNAEATKNNKRNK